MQNVPSFSPAIGLVESALSGNAAALRELVHDHVEPVIYDQTRRLAARTEADASLVDRITATLRDVVALQVHLRTGIAYAALNRYRTGNGGDFTVIIMRMALAELASRHVTPGKAVTERRRMLGTADPVRETLSARRLNAFAETRALGASPREYAESLGGSAGFFTVLLLRMRLLLDGTRLRIALRSSPPV